MPYPSFNSKPKLRYHAINSGGRGADPEPATRTSCRPIFFKTTRFKIELTQGIQRATFSFFSGSFAKIFACILVQSLGTDKKIVGLQRCKSSAKVEIESA